MNITRRTQLSALATAVLAPVTTSAVAALDDPDSVVTVMQYSAKNDASKAELEKRMKAMRDLIRKAPGCIENALFANRNPATKPHYVGVSRWKGFKDWENLWANDEVQRLVRSIGEVGDVVPGTFAAVK